MFGLDSNNVVRAMVSLASKFVLGSFVFADPVGLFRPASSASVQASGSFFEVVTLTVFLVARRHGTRPSSLCKG